jgi:hypothetical protein
MAFHYRWGVGGRGTVVDQVASLLATLMRFYKKISTTQNRKTRQ